MKHIELQFWASPASIYPRKRLNGVEIRTTTYKPGFYHNYGLKGYDFFRARKPLSITGLYIDGKQWMTDDPPHWWAMQEHAMAYSGEVLVAGLGLGLILHALAENEEVKTVVVIERDQRVIDLIEPLIQSTLGARSFDLVIIKADWYDVAWHGGFDGIFYDLLVGEGRKLGSHALSAMLNMKQRWPEAKVFRVHGFKNNLLNQQADAILAVERWLKERNESLSYKAPG